MSFRCFTQCKCKVAGATSLNLGSFSDKLWMAMNGRAMGTVTELTSRAAYMEQLIPIPISGFEEGLQGWLKCCVWMSSPTTALCMSTHISHTFNILFPLKRAPEMKWQMYKESKDETHEGAMWLHIQETLSIVLAILPKIQNTRQ